MFHKKTKPISPKDLLIKQMMKLLDQYENYYVEEEQYIEALCAAFLERKIKVNVDDETLLNIKQIMEEELQGENALFASIAIAKKLEQKCKPRSSLRHFLMSRFREEPLPHLIVWVYQQTLKKDKNMINGLSASIRMWSCTITGFQNLHKILNVFKIEIIKVPVELSTKPSQWNEFLAILSEMKTVFLSYGLFDLSNTELDLLAATLHSARVIYENGFDLALTTVDGKKTLTHGNQWERFIGILLESPNLIALTRTNFDYHFSLHSPELQQSFHQKLADSHVVSLKINFASHKSKQRKCHKQLERIIASNNRRVALSLEHGGLKYLIAYSIFNNPKTAKIYYKNQAMLPPEVREEMKGLCRFGLIGADRKIDRLRKNVDGRSEDEIYNLKI